ncbi:MAG: hypothetical protein K1Y36_07135 [Blastocatellia bacterium]|nr:hypothetical protein [Blastocatellia bacterium]
MYPASNLTERKLRPLFKRALICLVLGLCAMNISGCFVYNKLRAKDLLNTGARLYNAGKYDKAAAIFKEASQLNPDLYQAKLFYATALRSQVAGSSEEDKKIAREAIKVYEEMLNGAMATKSDAKDKDSAMAFIADLYSKLEDRENQKKWLESRAKLPGQKPGVVAECFYAIGVTFWEEAHKVSDKYVEANTIPPKYKQTKDWQPKDKDDATKKTMEGMKYINQALQADPSYANAYSYLNLLYREQMKLEDDEKKKAELEKMAIDATEKFQELNRKAAAEQGG